VIESAGKLPGGAAAADAAVSKPAGQ
jgi:hypothetical protein